MRYGDWELPGIATGHVLDVLAKLPENSVQMVCTSPPYWGLRDYKTSPQIWDGDPKCKHTWGSEIPGDPRGGSGTPTNKNNRGEGYGRDAVRGAFCTRCSAWRGNLGNEPTPDLYVAHMVAIFRAVRRVLRDDGTLFLNLGDSYAAAGYSKQDNTGGAKRISGGKQHHSPIPSGLKSKDLVGIPWRVAFALQADGWWLRSDIIWSKLNPMPESTTDRPTKSHEYIFLLSKSANYFFDMEAVREPHKWSHVGAYRLGEKSKNGGSVEAPVFGKGNTTGSFRAFAEGGRNIRSVWTITADPYRDAHFATFPREIPHRCIRAGTSEKGCCPTCGTPWERVVERQSECKVPRGTVPSSARAIGDNPQQAGVSVAVKTVGWKAGCDCSTHEPIPCTVMDIFAGSGTTLRVAEDLGRLWFGIDLSDEYLKLIKTRTGQRTVLGLTGRMAVKKNMSRK